MSIKEFEDISIPKWKLSMQGAAKKVYRVFSNSSEFVTVEAESATEAALKSGVTKVFMIKNGARDELTMIDKSQLFADSAIIPAEIPADAVPV